MKLDRSNIEAWLLDRIEGRLTSDQESELTAFLLAHPDLAEELGELPVVEQDDVTFTGKEDLKRTLPPTGEVNARNLDEFLAARLEGELGPEEQDGLERYIALHPGAAKAARQMAVTRLGQGRIPFAEKGSITRTFPPIGLPDRHRIDDFLVAKLHGELNSDQERALAVMIASDPAVAKAWAVMQRTRIEAPAIVFEGKAGLKKKEVKVIPLWSRPIVRMAAAASVALLFGIWWFDRGRDVIDEHASVDPVRKAVGTNTPAASNDQGMNTAVTPQVDRTAVPSGMGTEPVQVTPEHPVAPVERAPRTHMERLSPVLASVQSGAINAELHGTRPVPQVPISNDPISTAVGATGQGTMSMGELLASAVRTEVLEQPTGTPRSLDRDDAVALVDKGLQAVGGRAAGLNVERTEQRRRFNLRLGGGLAIAASTSR